MKKPVRVGVFRRPGAADAAVHALVAAGFPKDSISVVCPTCTDGRFEEYRQDTAGAHAPEVAAAGGAVGGVLGGLTAAAGIAASGGTGLVFAGPLLAGLAGGSLFGGFVGAMLSRGFDPEIANFYDQALQKGQVLVAVESPHGAGAPSLHVAERVLAEAGADPLELPKG